MGKKEKTLNLLTHKIAYLIYTVLTIGSGTAFVGLPAKDKLVDKVIEIQNLQQQYIDHAETIIIQQDEIIANQITDLYFRFSKKMVDSVREDVAKDLFWKNNRTQQ